MRFLASITTPVWIFLLTLLSIIAAGRLVSNNSCERLESTCQAEAAELHPDNKALQHAYVIRCSQQSCSTTRQSALVPLSMLIAGGMFFAVWNRQSAAARRTRSARERDGAPVAVQPAVAPGTDSAPRRRRSDSISSKAPAKRRRDTPPKSAPRNDALYTTVLENDASLSKEKLANSLDAFIGPADPGVWRAAPVSDLELLARAIAIAALAGPEATTAAYRRPLGSPQEEGAPEMQARTKRELQEDCVAILRRDLEEVQKQAAASSPDSGTIALTVEDLQAANALDGLARCSKTALLRLLVFLQQPR